ncbi:MAG: SGNH/GDSL hydrolase family protein [Pirellulales bacterium]|nr:SGNH/GDSL hydrolase family protein [Pirellulales bacterium]
MAVFVVFALPLALALVACLVLRVAVRRFRASTGWVSGAWLVLGNALVLVMLLAALFVVAESYYRWIYDTTEGPDLSRASQEWFRRHYQSNNGGFRDNIDYAMQPAAGRRRVSFVGDSFTAGHGVPDVNDRFANRVRRSLAPDVEVHCLAINGLDTAHQADLLEELFAQGYRTDLVVLVYCANDLSDLIPDLPRQGNTVKERVASLGGLRESYALDMWHCRWIMATDPDSLRYFPDLAAAYEGPLWAQQQDRVGRLREVCREHGAELAIVLFPFMLEIEGTSFEPAYDKVVALAAAEGIPLLDLRAVFARYPEEPLNVSAVDAHPNARANEIAGVAISEWLRTNLLTPREPPAK